MKLKTAKLLIVPWCFKIYVTYSFCNAIADVYKEQNVTFSQIRLLTIKRLERYKLYFNVNKICSDIRVFGLNRYFSKYLSDTNQKTWLQYLIKYEKMLSLNIWTKMCIYLRIVSVYLSSWCSELNHQQKSRCILLWNLKNWFQCK